MTFLLLAVVLTQSDGAPYDACAGTRSVREMHGGAKADPLFTKDLVDCEAFAKESFTEEDKRLCPKEVWQAANQFRFVQGRADLMAGHLTAVRDCVERVHQEAVDDIRRRQEESSRDSEKTQVKEQLEKETAWLLAAPEGRRWVLSLFLCNQAAARDFEMKVIADEKKKMKIAGVANKTKLYESADAIVTVDKQIARGRAALKGAKPMKCPAPEAPRLPGKAFCDSAECVQQAVDAVLEQLVPTER